ncbi:MAG: epoxyqueuosine reductase QueH [Actinobacteria bacterium]|nr:epoxyqueuosine reductase QueH [Actinomycetota bacterium]
MKMFLHTCCAPCLIYPYNELLKENYQIVSYYYNPNIHPYSEFEKRLKTLEDYCLNNNIRLQKGNYDIHQYLKKIVEFTTEEERCRICYSIRLEQTAKTARENGFKLFSTTILVSPHQKHEMVKEIGEFVGKKYNLKFVYNDFRRGYREGVLKSKELGMYRQKYCGCLFSEMER